MCVPSLFVDLFVCLLAGFVVSWCACLFLGFSVCFFMCLLVFLCVGMFLCSAIIWFMFSSLLGPGLGPRFDCWPSEWPSDFTVDLAWQANILYPGASKPGRRCVTG